MKNWFRLFLLIGLLLTVGLISAQCPMCRMSVESNLENGGTIGRTINAGIMYMLLMPYILVGTLAYVWHKNKKKQQDWDNASDASGDPGASLN
ncbi:MAG: hypothetical protein WBP00_09545 [Saprospiraceae bacterium]